MIQLPFSIIFLSIVMLLVYLGFVERVLDRMRLTDRIALLLIAFLIVSHFLPHVSLTPYLGLNLGALVPLAVIIYLLVTTSNLERIRAIILSVVVAFIVGVTDLLLPIHPGSSSLDIDPLFVPGFIAGILSYIFTRSRRSAFISAIGSIFFVDIWAVISITLKTYHEQIILGGGGIFDALLINGVIAVVIAEVIGEITERIHRGPAKIRNNKGDDNE